jgi:hypothetical protein
MTPAEAGLPGLAESLPHRRVWTFCFREVATDELDALAARRWGSWSPPWC